LARIFFTENGRPVGHADLAYEDGRITSDRLRQAIPDQPPAKASLPDEAPFATVAIPTLFARGDALTRAVAALSRQDYPWYEILVVDNRPAHAQDAAEHAALECVDPRVRVLSQPQPGASAARNLALREARGEFIAFTDDDAAADRNWLRSLATRFAAAPDADCVTGLVLPAELETSAQIWFEESGNAPNRRYAAALFQRIEGRRFQVADRYAGASAAPMPIYALGDMGAGSNMAFRVDALRELGGFDEALGPGSLTSHGGEDILAFLQVLASGRGLAVEPSAYVLHWHRRTYPELRAQLHGYGRAFTAMLVAAIVDEPRHLLGLAGVVPAGALALLGIRSHKTSQRSAGYPKQLHRTELTGMLGGPWWYLRSRLRARADRAALGAQSAAYATTQST
jgi:hypothetical protein